MGPSSASAAPRPGDVVAGKYRIERQLGAGGMGVVYAARHIHLNDPVALKMVLPEGADGQAARERFQREAQMAVKIRSEHVARVIDLGFLENGAPYMAMEFLHGKDLAQMVEAYGALPVASALDYVLQACEAIAEAHSLGMVHRDLKPANLFLGKRPDGSPIVKVLDFGISKAPNAAQLESRLTSTGALMGSPSYMSPEQIRDAKHVDHRCDVWAMGMILYELLTNRIAFNATTVPGLLASIVADPPVPIGQLRPDLAPGLSAAIMRCLEKDLALRTQSIAELATSLAPFAPPPSQRSIERVVALTPSTPSIPAPITSRTAFDATHPGAMSAVSAHATGGGGSTNNAAWGNTVGNTVGAPAKTSSALLAAVSGGLVVLLVGGVGLGATLYARRSHEAAAGASPPPAVSSVAAAPSAAPAPPAPTAMASAAASVAASAAPTASVAVKKRPARGTAPASDNRNGDLGGAIDSRK